MPTKRRSKKPAAPAAPKYPQTHEVMGEPYLGSAITASRVEPSCFNGVVHIRRYRVTVEEIAEPVEVLRERLVKLWRIDDNHHHREPLRRAAAELGMSRDDLPMDLYGIDNPNTKAAAELAADRFSRSGCF